MARYQDRRLFDMDIVWTAVNDDSLLWVDKSVEFLQSEFCPVGADPIWSREYFEWKLGNAHPAGRGYMSVAVSNGSVVGTSTLTRKRLLIDGVEVIGGEVGDSYSSAVVNRRGRPDQFSALDSNPSSYVNKSIFGRLASDVRMRAESDGLEIIYGTPNKNAYPGWIKRLGYFDAQCSLGTYTRPSTQWLLHRKPYLTALEGVLRGFEKFSIIFQRSFGRMTLGNSISISETIPQSDDIDALWRRTKPKSGFALVRDAAYWRHRYMHQPLAEYDFYCVHEERSLIGIVVTRTVCVGQGRSVLYFVEWMLIGNDKLFQQAILEIISRNLHLKVHAFSLWATDSGSDARDAKRCLFFSRADSKAPIILADSVAARSLEKNFQFYLGSSDAV